MNKTSYSHIGNEISHNRIRQMDSTYESTEASRAAERQDIQTAIVSDDNVTERIRLEATYGSDNVWDTNQARNHFDFEGFMAPFVTVVRKSDNLKGSLEFQHSPRFYFNFNPTR